MSTSHQFGYLVRIISRVFSSFSFIEKFLKNLKRVEQRLHESIKRNLKKQKEEIAVLSKTDLTITILLKKIIIEDILNPTSAVQDDRSERFLSTKKD